MYQSYFKPLKVFNDSWSRINYFFNDIIIYYIYILLYYIINYYYYYIIIYILLYDIINFKFWNFLGILCAFESERNRCRKARYKSRQIFLLLYHAELGTVFAGYKSKSKDPTRLITTAHQIKLNYYIIYKIIEEIDSILCTWIRV